MNAEFFSTVHTSLTALLALQKGERSLEQGLLVLKKVLDEGEPVADKAELSAVSSAVVVGIRVLADGSLRSGNYKILAEYYASILDKIFKFSNIEISLKWQEHVKPLLAILLSDTSGSNLSVQIIISAIRGFLQHICKDNQLSAELFSSSSTPLVGKLVTVCLEIIINDARNTESRQFAIDILRLIIARNEARDTISLIIPGLASKLISFLCAGGNTNESIVEGSIQIIFDSIALCLENGTFIEEESTTTSSLQRTSAWGKNTAERLVPMIKTLLSRLSVHNSEKVKLQLLKSTYLIHLQCSEIFQNSLENIIIDLTLIYLVNQQIRVSDAALNVLENLKTSNVIVYLNDRLVELTEKLPNLVRAKGKGDLAINQCVAIIEALKENISWMALTRSPILTNFIRSISSVIRFEHKKIFFTLKNSSSMKDTISTLPLKFEVEINQITRLCHVLAEKGGVEMVDLLLDEARDCCASDKTALLIIGSLILEHLTTERDALPVISIAETCCDELENAVSEIVPKDYCVEDLSEDLNSKTVLNISLISCLTASIKQLSDSSYKIILRSIYRILQFCNSNNWIIATMADISLKDLAKFYSVTVSEFLMSHNSYLLSSVSLACRSFSNFSTAPLAFGAFLDRCEDSNAFAVVYHQITSLLYALDFHKQTNTWVILRALKAFLVAMNKWFPEIIREEKSKGEDETEEKEEIPKEISITEQILIRAKHLLSLEAFPVRILVMEIQKEGFWLIRNFDNQLLPMIHQNWSSVAARLEDSNLVCRRAAFLVIVEMSKVSKVFIYRRVLSEAWPRIVSFLQKNLQRKGALPQNSAFRYCEAVINNMPGLLRNIEVKEEDWQRIQPVLQLFTQEFIHPNLRSATNSSISAINEYLLSTK